MKRFVVLPVSLLILLLTSFTTADKWIKFTSKEGHYSIDFPTAPTENSETDTTNEHVPFVIHFATCTPVDTEVYLMGWIDMSKFYPKDKTMLQILEDSRDGATGSMHATEVNTIKTVLVGTMPYIEFTFKTSEYIGKDRIYAINKFQYSIIALGSLTTGITPKMDKFITSFKHLP